MLKQHLLAISVSSLSMHLKDLTLQIPLRLQISVSRNLVLIWFAVHFSQAEISKICPSACSWQLPTALHQGPTQAAKHDVAGQPGETLLSDS